MMQKFQPNRMGMTGRLVKKAHGGHDTWSDSDIENQELKATPATGWPLQPVSIYIFLLLFWLIKLLLMSSL